MERAEPPAAAYERRVLLSAAQHWYLRVRLCVTPLLPRPAPRRPPSPNSALFPRRELPDGAARPGAPQLKQLVVAALRELHGEVTARGRRCAARCPTAPNGGCVCRLGPLCLSTSWRTRRKVSAPS